MLKCSAIATAAISALVCISRPASAQDLAQAPAASAAGWTFVFFVGDPGAEVLIHRVADQVGVTSPEVWVETEGANEQKSTSQRYASEVALIQFDCQRQVSRQLQITRYSGSFLTGQANSSASSNAPWPNSPTDLDQQIGPLVCLDGKNAIATLILDGAPASNRSGTADAATPAPSL